MNARQVLIFRVLIVAALVAVSIPAKAEHDERRGEGRHDRWHGDIRHFDRHDLPTWRAGRWRHARHDGRVGWWWVVAGAWYFYPQPVYPYPDPYMPPVVVVQPNTAPAPQPAQPAAQPATTSWYYCEASKGYYPYVPGCPGGWKVVPATPPDVPAK